MSAPAIEMPVASDFLTALDASVTRVTVSPVQQFEALDSEIQAQAATAADILGEDFFNPSSGRA